MPASPPSGSACAAPIWSITRASWRLKLRALELVFQSFRERHLAAGTEGARAFLEFRTAIGRPLERQAVFDALHEHVLRSSGAWSWHQWPDGYRHPDHPEVAAFARAHSDRVDFFAWLQWLADEQLGCRPGARPRGGHGDRPVSGHRGRGEPGERHDLGQSGGQSQRRQRRRAPDWFNLNGQNWVLAPLSPVGLREHAYQVFAATLRHNMRHAGAVRIDHVMGLRRLFWIPDGASPAEGAYVRYPFEDLVRIIALEIAAPSLPGDRRGSRDGAARLPAIDAKGGAAVLPRALFRAWPRRRLPRARGLPAAGVGVGVNPRSADPQGILAPSRRPLARGARSLSGRCCPLAGPIASVTTTAPCCCARWQTPGSCRQGLTPRPCRMSFPTS